MGRSYKDIRMLDNVRQTYHDRFGAFVLRKHDLVEQYKTYCPADARCRHHPLVATLPRPGDRMAKSLHSIGKEEHTTTKHLQELKTDSHTSIALSLKMSRAAESRYMLPSRYLISSSRLKALSSMCGVIAWIALVVAALWLHTYKSMELWT
jgi:hypothetical protein